MVISGGVNIYPREIEEILFAHPDIADVAVIGVPDEKYGEVVHAAVVLKADADQEAIRAYSRSFWSVTGLVDRPKVQSS